jgi:hypothetical protein
VVVATAVAWACSTGGGFMPVAEQGGNSSVFSGGTGSVDPNAGGSAITGPLTTPPDGGSWRRAKQCDALGLNCKCLNLASLGDRASKSYGVGKDGQPSSTTAFDAWLSEKSNAVVTFVLNYQPLTPEYLAGFDVIILQDLRKWSLTASDIQNLSDWVNGGGGLIALNGYFNDNDDEVNASNKVLQFAGMSYLGGGQSGSVPGNQCGQNSLQICQQQENPNPSTGPCCYCWNDTMPVTDWTSGHPISKDIKAVGAMMGRQVSPGDGTVVATYDGKPVAASKTMGQGKVFLWCDEWATYTSSWSGGYTPSNLAQMTPEQFKYEQCYDPVLGQWLHADVALQVMQFWYNSIHFVAPPTECDFVIDEPSVLI